MAAGPNRLTPWPTMSTTTPLNNLVRRENAQLAATVCDWLGVSVTFYKTVRFVFRAVAIGTIVATAILPEASLPPVGYVTLGAVALGPDAFEAYATRNE